MAYIYEFKGKITSTSRPQTDNVNTIALSSHQSSTVTTLYVQSAIGNVQQDKRAIAEKKVLLAAEKLTW